MGGQPWLPGTIVAKSSDPVGYDCKFNGTQQQILAAFVIRRCTLMINESVEIFCGDDGWLPGTVSAKSNDPMGYECKYNGTQQQVIGTYCIRRCTLMINESVEIWSGDNGWLPGTIIAQ